MYEFYFFAIKKLLEILLLHRHYLLFVSVGQPKDSLANHSFTIVNPFVVSRQTGMCLCTSITLSYLTLYFCYSGMLVSKFLDFWEDDQFCSFIIYFKLSLAVDLIFIYLYVCVCVCMYVCMYIYIYILYFKWEILHYDLNF